MRLTRTNSWNENLETNKTDSAMIANNYAWKDVCKR